MLPEGYQDLDLTIGFSEAMDTSGVDVYDVTLIGQNFGTFYYPSAVTFNEAGTELTISFWDVLLAEDIYNVALTSGDFGFQDLVGLDLDGEYSGTLSSGNGLEGGDFVIQISVDAPTRQLPVPLTAIEPLGSLIYQTPYASSGVIAPGSDTDDFTIELDANQTVTLLVGASAGLQPTVALFDPPTTRSQHGHRPHARSEAVFQATLIPGAGTYRITVGSASGQGLYSVQLIVNAAVEEEAHGGTVNNDPASAQSIEGSFIPLADDSDRGAVRGVSGDDDVYAFELTAGQSLTAALKFDTPLTGLYGPRDDYSMYSPWTVALGDVDNDDHLDMVTSSGFDYSSIFSVRLGLGDGLFGDYSSFTNDGYGEYALGITLEDVNNDDNLDLIAANYFGGYYDRSVTVQLGNGDGTFQPSVGYFAGYYNYSVAVGDVTGDGMPDIVTTTDSYSGNLHVLPNNGDGTFGTAVAYDVGPTRWT